MTSASTLRNALLAMVCVGAGACTSDASAPSGSKGGAAGAGGTNASGGEAGHGGTGVGATAGSGGATAGSAGTAGHAGAAGSRDAGDAGRDAADRDGSAIDVGTLDVATTDASSDRVDAPITTSKTFVYTSGYAAQISIFTLDRSSGSLITTGMFDSTVPSPSYLAFSPDKRFLYALNEGSGASSKVVALKINAVDGSLQKINEGTTGGDGAPHLSVTPDGKWVLVAHYTSGHVSTLAVDANGGVAATPTDVERPANDTSHQVLTDATGAFAFVPNVNANTVFQYKFDVSSGQLTARGSVAGFPSGAGPRHLAFHPTKNVAYTMNETAVTVTSLVYDPGTGALSNLETIDSLPAGAPKTGTGAHVAVHPSGRFVYTSNRGHDSISIFDVDAATGRLTMSGNDNGGGAIKTPRDFAIDPAGQYLIAANQNAANVIVFAINANDGKLTKTTTTAVTAGPSFVGFLTLP